MEERENLSGMSIKRKPDRKGIQDMKIAVVTGASSGMGREFVYQIAESYPHLDEIWAIARGREALEQLKAEVPKVRIQPFDITKEECLQEMKAVLEREKPDIRLLVNAAGAGTQKKVLESEVKQLTDMTQLNCTAITAVSRICLPYCKEKSRILCLASGAAFIPQPGFAVYAATKAYVLSFARALNRELQGKITVTAVCPGPVNTPFLEKMGGKEQMPAYKKPFIASPKAVVKRALRDGAKGKELSVYGSSIKALRILCKMLPHSVILKFMQK